MAGRDIYVVQMPESSATMLKGVLAMNETRRYVPPRLPGIWESMLSRGTSAIVAKSKDGKKDKRRRTVRTDDRAHITALHQAASMAANDHALPIAYHQRQALRMAAQAFNRCTRVPEYLHVVAPVEVSLEDGRKMLVDRDGTVTYL